MKKKILGIFICMLMICSIFGNMIVTADVPIPYPDEPVENGVADEGDDPDLSNMSMEEIILYVSDNCMQDPPDRFVDGLDELPIQQPISYGSRPIVYEAPWSVHDIDWIIDLLGVASESHNGEADSYQAWTAIYTSTGPLFGWAQVTAYAFQGIVFNPPVTDTYSITFDYTVQGFIEGAISDPLGTAEGEVALWFKTNTEEHKEDIITLQTAPPLFYSYDEDFYETLTVSMQDEMYEGSFEWIEVEAGQQDTSFAELTCWGHAQGALDDRGQQGWGDGAVLNSITIDWPNHPPETPETPDGPTEGEVGIEYTYSTRAFDPDDFGDSLWYKWDWGDGSISDWIGPYSSGELASANHIWTVTGDYDVKVKVKDSYDEESDWSSALTVTITEENNPPTAVIDSITPNPAFEGQTVSFEGHGEDSDGTITAYNWRSSIDGELSTQSSFDTSSLSVGTHTIYFKVKDNDDESSTEVTETLNIETQEYPIITELDGPTAITLLELYREQEYVATGVDPQGDQIYFEWNVGEQHLDWDGPFDSPYAYTTSVVWGSQTISGDRYVEVRAKDVHGNIGPWKYLGVAMPQEESSCFLASTQIAMADGTYKNIEEIEIGDMVLSCDRFNSRTTDAMVTKVYHHTSDEMGDYYLIINDNLGVTPNHPLYINEMWKHVGDAVVGDYLLGNDGESIQIELIERIYEQVPTYNFDITADGAFGVHTYITDGTLVSTKIDLEILASFETMMQGHPSYQELLV